MDTVETSTRAAVALVVTILLLGVTWWAWRRRGAASGLRWLGIALLPVAAWLTGTLGLVAAIIDDVSRYASRLVLSPVVWAGVAVLVVAVLLIATGTAMRERGLGVRSGRAVRRSPDAPAEAAGPARSAPTKAAKDDDPLDDDIAAILKRRGIS